MLSFFIIEKVKTIPIVSSTSFKIQYTPYALQTQTNWLPDASRYVRRTDPFRMDVYRSSQRTTLS